MSDSALDRTAGPVRDVAVVRTGHVDQAFAPPLRATRAATRVASSEVDNAPPAGSRPGTARTGSASVATLLQEHADQLLGPKRDGRGVRVTVTVPAAAADDATIVHALLRQGVNCVRIDCTYGDVTSWSRMIENVRRAEQALGQTCKVQMDLAGPRLRTGPLEAEPQVLRVRPERNSLGRVVAPARIWVSAGAPAPFKRPSEIASLTVPEWWLRGLRESSWVVLRDAREQDRRLVVAEATADGCWLETGRAVYIVPETILRHRGGGIAGEKAVRLGALTPRPGAILLRQGDQLILTRDLAPGRRAVVDAAGQVIEPARIGCTLARVFDDVRPGDAVWFGEGRIGGTIEQVGSDEMRVRITRARSRGGRLHADVVIRFPDSALRVPALTGKDVEDLAFIARHADIVGLSFASTASDVDALRACLARLGDRRPAIMLKLETRRGFDNLPAMLLAATRSSYCGVTIADTDTAREPESRRVAGGIEETLRACWTAHVPVIWPAQVLESLARGRWPAQAGLAGEANVDSIDGVMLDQGPRVVDVEQALDELQRRMREHRSNRPVVRPERRSAPAWDR